MILDVGTTTVSTAGTEQQISNTANRVLWIKAKALAANSGIAYLAVGGQRDRSQLQGTGGLDRVLVYLCGCGH